MAELEKLQVELQEAVRESEKLKVKIFSNTLIMIIHKNHFNISVVSLSFPDFSDGLEEYSRRGGEGDTRVQMSTVPILPAVQ